MIKGEPLVSIIIPTKNSGAFLDNCFKSIKKQSYKNIEAIIVDSNSIDKTIKIAGKYQAEIYHYSPKVPAGTFDAPHKRNYGVKKAKGDFVYYLDADMELTEKVVEEAVKLCQSSCDAVIIPEDSFGKGIWAKAKNLERRCYWGDDTVEAPRFVKKNVWYKLGGLDENLGGGGDDWDLHQRLLENGYLVGRIKSLVRHNEGELKLRDLFRKRFRYGRDSVKYLVKRPGQGFKSYFPIRKAYLKNWKLFVGRPIDALAFIIMRTVEYSAGFAGIIYSLVKGNK